VIRILFWLAFSLAGDAAVVGGGISHQPVELAIGVLISAGGWFMLGRCRRERSDYDPWPLIEAWDPDDWFADPLPRRVYNWDRS
jgi:hypothetical protein